MSYPYPPPGGFAPVPFQRPPFGMSPHMQPPPHMAMPPHMGMPHMGPPPFGMPPHMGMPHMRPPFMPPPMQRPPMQFMQPPMPAPLPGAMTSDLKPRPPSLGPKTSLFVGNIPPAMSDIVLRQVLGVCGKVTMWNRVQEPSGKLGNFGFCDYENADDALRALRLVRGLRVAGVELTMKVEPKTQEALDAHLKTQGKQDNVTDGAAKIEDDVATEEMRSLIHTANPSASIVFGPPSEVEPKKVEPDEDSIQAQLKAVRETVEKTMPDEQIKKLEREKRRKEEQYADLTRQFTSKERQRIQVCEREDQREQEKVQERQRETNRLKKFDAEYDDDILDSKYYRSSDVEQLRRERAREIEWESADREAEAKESKIETAATVSDEALVPGITVARASTAAAAAVQAQAQALQALAAMPAISPRVASVASPALQKPATPEAESGKVGFGLALAGKKPTKNIKPLFAGEDEDGNDEAKKRRKLVRIEYTDEELRARGIDPEEERKKAIKKVIDAIPVKNTDLFAHPLDWDTVDAAFVATRVKPWIGKKIQLYIGEDEPSLVEFIASKVVAHSSATDLLKDVAVILDEEAEAFVVKLWRLLVYEIEAKKLGLPSQGASESL